MRDGGFKLGLGNVVLGGERRMRRSEGSEGEMGNLPSCCGLRIRALWGLFGALVLTT